MPLAEGEARGCGKRGIRRHEAQRVLVPGRGAGVGGEAYHLDAEVRADDGEARGRGGLRAEAVLHPQLVDGAGLQGERLTLPLALTGDGDEARAVSGLPLAPGGAAGGSPAAGSRVTGLEGAVRDERVGQGGAHQQGEEETEQRWEETVHEGTSAQI